jgi:hypothetical protein
VYRAPPEYDEEIAGPVRLHVPIHAASARLVQHAWEALPDRPRLILKAEYLDSNRLGYVAMLARMLNAPLPDGGFEATRSQRAQTIGLPIHAYEDALQYAVNRVEVAINP